MKRAQICSPSHSLPTMIASPVHKSATAATAFVGAVANVALAIYLFGVWRSLAWEPGSEWEGSRFTLSRDGARLVCGLFSAYFAAASAISVFGLAGIIKVPFSLPTFAQLTPTSSPYLPLFAYTATMSLATLHFAPSSPYWHPLWP